MYKIIEFKTGDLIEEVTSPRWVKQQHGVDFPIVAKSYEDADGVVLSDGNTMLGIEGRNMQNYEPLVTVEEISAEPYLFQRIQGLETELAKAKEENKKLQEMSQSALAELLLIQAQGMEGGV